MLSFKRTIEFTLLLLAGCSSTVVEPGASGSTSSGAGGAGSSSSNSSASTTGSGGSFIPQCTTDADCLLYSDCCTCEALGPSATPPDCAQQNCKQGLCSMYGAAQAICQYGTCTIAPVYSCDASQVFCKSIPPSCKPGSLPEVKGQCWTGKCVTSWLCDVVSDCGDCRADQLCVESFNDGPTGPWFSCRAIPAGCGAGANCACANAPVCAPGGFTACNDVPGGIFCGF